MTSTAWPEPDPPAEPPTPKPPVPLPPDEMPPVPPSEPGTPIPARLARIGVTARGRALAAWRGLAARPA